MAAQSPQTLHTDAPGMSRYVTQAAVPEQIGEILTLIREHGPNPWNYLPEVELAAHLSAIRSGRTQAVVALLEGQIVAVVTFEPSDAFHRYQPGGREIEWQGHIGEAVVHRQHRGQGLGTQLLKAAVARLQQMGLVEIYVERHEDNEGSAGMMRNAGFVVIDVFDDPRRRDAGSRRTTVSRYRPHP
ncbi:GNAT family N-acetyltransferase [Lysobacter gummosus]|uniref:GNAT family N-acetyltransferase n=1 Tax=Lysobacter gummosus TaxID=262324 RepID=A0ABY3XDL8_9GAMM|nr:GNAT family N-acetyltransferase [Lysobacter gummosus]UNP28836.1 GNAT family N-acetyltransferase [Lysobacter gummosus]